MDPQSPQDPRNPPAPERPRRAVVAPWSQTFGERGTAPPLLWDGGVGTALLQRGLDLTREPPEAWLLRHPEVVSAIHAEFAAAGADVLQTNSFGLIRIYAGPVPWPADLGPRPELAALVEACVRLARQGAEAAAIPASPITPSAPSDALDSAGKLACPANLTAPPPALPPEVIGCLGPSGRAEHAPESLAALYEQAAAAFVAAGVSTLHLETCLEPQELKLALAAIASAAPALTLLVSLTLSMGQSGPETPLGIPLARMLRELEHSPQPLAAVGINCSQPARRLHAAVAALAEWSDGRLPILVQPQVGEPAPDCRFPKKPETPDRFAHDLLRLRSEGAAALGGCCGATPDHIRALRHALL